METMTDHINITLKEYGVLNDKDQYEVWDEEQKTWMDFGESCYKTTSLFPKPEEALYPINLITLISSKTGEQTTWGNREYTGNSETVKNYYWIPDEKELLTSFVKFFRKQHYDIVTGWFFIQFDIRYILKRIKNLGLDLSLSPIDVTNERETVNKKTGDKTYYCSIAGLTLLDYKEVYIYFTKALYTLESYSLQYVSKYEGLAGKLEFEGQINDIFKRDWNKFVEYNIQDTRLIEQLDSKRKFIALALMMASESIIPLEKVLTSIVLIEGYMLRYMHDKGLVMHDRKSQINDEWLELGLFKCNGELQNVEVENGLVTFEPFKIKGAYVEAHPGFYANSMSNDVESLYPIEIMTYNVSPETKVFNPSQSEIEQFNLIKTPINGIYYRREKGILPTIVSDIMVKRREMKALKFETNDPQLKIYYDTRQMVWKIFINSIYGIMGSEYFHFYDVDNARVVTRGGRVLIKFLSSQTNRYFKEYFPKVAHKYFPNCGNIVIKNDVVALIDTDSNFLCLDEIKKQCAKDMTLLDFANIMELQVLKPFYDKLLDIHAKKYDVENLVNFKREGIILKQLILAKKKYLTLLIQNEKEVYDPPKLKVTGVEIKRSDTPSFCRSNIEQVVNTIFEGDIPSKENVIYQMKQIKKEFIKQNIEDISFNKSVNGYTKYYNGSNIDMVNSSIQLAAHMPIHVRGSIFYNLMVKKHKLPLMEISDGTKVKYVYVKDKNFLGTNVIAFIGKYPKEFEKLFEIDYETQFEKSFVSVIGRLFEPLNWGEVNLKGNKLEGML